MSASQLHVIWMLAGWRAVYTGVSVYLFVDDVLAASKTAENREEADSIAAEWRESVAALTALEQRAERFA